MKTLRQILIASILATAISSTALAGNISTKDGNISTFKDGNISTFNGNISTKTDSVSTVLTEGLLSVLSILL